MRVLIACEFSGRIREMFKSKGHDAWSCDFLPTEAEGNHIQGDCLDAIKDDQWDMIIMHPPCTALSVSGNSTYAKGKPKHHERITAIEWTMALWELAKQHAPMVCMENPVGVLPIKATQFIQPWQFGHNESKKTGLGLYGLQPLQATKVMPMPMCNYRENQTPSGQNKLGPSLDRWKLRSKTYPGIASAMADQWGGGVLDESISSL